MINKLFTNRFDAIITPARNEILSAQEQAFERIRGVLQQAEAEVARESQFMSEEQRMQSVESELEKAEEHLLSALKSVAKALCYIAPMAAPLMPSFVRVRPIKEINGTVEKIER